MRIMHLLTSDRFSGAENVVCQIINFFKNDRSFEMIYCSPNGEIGTSLKEREISFSPLDDFSFASVQKKIAEIKPDIIHAHDMRASVIATIAGIHIPIVSHIHVNNFDTRGISLKALLYYFAAIKAKHIFWVSRSSFEGYLFHNSLRKKSEILQNIIDISALQKKAGEDKKVYHYDIAYLGRLSVQKNPQRLINIIRGVVRLYPEVKVAIIGTGVLLDEITALVNEFGIVGNIDFLGFLSNPFKILQDAKLMIMTSRWEGTPMSALEAMALGVPIVSTPVDGMCDLVDNSVTGFLSDNDEELIESCYHLIKDTNLQQSFSNASLQKAKRIMNIEKYKETIMNAYQKAISNK